MKCYLQKALMENRFEDYPDELPLWSAPFGTELLNYVSYRKGINALDVGYGNGFPLIELAMRLGESSKVYGIDPSDRAFNTTSSKVNSYGLYNIKLIRGIAENIPLETNAIDLIVSNNGINNVQNLNRVIKECSRIISPNGQFVFTFNSDTSLFEFYNQLINAFRELKLHKHIDQIKLHIAHKRPSVNLMISTLTRHDFIIKDVVQSQFNYKFSDGTALFNHNFVRSAFMRSWIKLIPEERLEEVFTILEDGFNEISLRFGGVQLSIPFVVVNAFKVNSFLAQQNTLIIEK